MDTTPSASSTSSNVSLQWSHDLSAMDTTIWLATLWFDDELQWSHDLSAMDTRRPVERRPPTPDRFNGAMTFQPWILRVSVAADGLDRTLQWSHDLSAMDTTRGWTRTVKRKIASMEP